MTEEESIIRASSHFLCEPLPNDYHTLYGEEIMDFIRDNKWEPFDQWKPNDIWELIENLASDFLSISKAK